MTLSVSRPFVGGVLTLVFALSVGSCADDLNGTPPPDNVFYFPIGLTLNEAGTKAYVSNSNFDLRFNSGWLSTIDLQAVVDSGSSQINLAEFGSSVVENQLRIPSLGGTVARGNNVLYVAHRTDRLVSVIELANESQPTCGDPNATANLSTVNTRTDCDSDHLFEITGDAAETVSIDDSDDLTDIDVADPFSLQTAEADGAGTFLLTGQLSRPRLNALQVVDSSPFLEFGEGAGRSELLAVQGGRLNTLVRVPVPDTATEDYNYLAAAGIVLSGGAERAGIVHVDLDAYLTGEERFNSSFTVGTFVGGREIADLVFSPDGQRAFAATRVNVRTAGDSARGLVYRLDTTIEPIEFLNQQGEIELQRRPRYATIATTSLRGQPSGIIYLKRDAASDLIVVSDL
ncbi:MAG: hypothetical protein AAFY60_17765, partial [Myxococcota bacterium]